MRVTSPPWHHLQMRFPIELAVIYLIYFYLFFFFFEILHFVSAMATLVALFIMPQMTHFLCISLSCRDFTITNSSAKQTNNCDSACVSRVFAGVFFCRFAAAYLDLVRPCSACVCLCLHVAMCVFFPIKYHSGIWTICADRRRCARSALRSLLCCLDCFILWHLQIQSTSAHTFHNSLALQREAEQERALACVSLP